MSYRKIEINGVAYQYVVGRTHTKVKGLNAIPNNRIGQYVWHITSQRDMGSGDDRDRSLILRVTPKDIANFIVRSGAGDLFLDVINPPEGFDVGKFYHVSEIPLIAR